MTHPIIPNRAQLDRRLDAVFALSNMTIFTLRIMAARYGVSAKGSRGRLMLRLYRGAVADDSVIWFPYQERQ